MAPEFSLIFRFIRVFDKCRNMHRVSTNTVLELICFKRKSESERAALLWWCTVYFRCVSEIWSASVDKLMRISVSEERFNMLAR